MHLANRTTLIEKTEPHKLFAKKKKKQNLDGINCNPDSGNIYCNGKYIHCLIVYSVNVYFS